MERWRTALAIAIMMAGSAGRAQAPTPLDPATPPAVVRTLAMPDNRVTIPISIGGRGPWNFILDTAAQRTVISRDLAQRLELPARGSVMVVGVGGEATVQTVALPKLGFGASSVDDIEAPVMDGAHLGAAGLLGLDGLHAKRLLLNFRTGRMDISESRKAARDPDAIVVEARRRNGQLILLNSDVNGLKVNIILDTGTAISIGNMALMKALTRGKAASTLRRMTLTGVTGDSVSGPWSVIKTVRMGKAVLVDMPVMFADAQTFKELKLDKPALLLGIDALRMFDRVVIDFGRGKVDFLLPDGSALDARQMAGVSRAAG